jgi:hypothetical protein
LKLKATAEARRMLIIAEVIQSDEQIRIAKEILDDCTMLSEMNKKFLFIYNVFIKNIIFLLNNQV